MQLHQKEQLLAMRVWRYISKPFQITKVLEILYALDWIWYAVIATVPERFISGGLFPELRAVWSTSVIAIVLGVIATVHVIGLWNNVLWLRKTVLVFNIAILVYLSTTYLLAYPIPAGVGYLVILIGVSIFAFLRMDESH